MHVSQQTAGGFNHIASFSIDENNIETISFNTSYGNTNSLLNFIRQASYIRISALGNGADMIVTINEEII